MCAMDSAKRRLLCALTNKCKFDLVCLQETKRDFVYDFSLNSVCEDHNYDSLFKPSVGISGGSVMLWKKDLFVVKEHFIGTDFVGF